MSLTLISLFILLALSTIPSVFRDEFFNRKFVFPVSQNGVSLEFQMRSSSKTCKGVRCCVSLLDGMIALPAIK